MRLAVLKERRPYETRVAATPDIVKKYVDMGVQVYVEKGAGQNAFFSDDDFQKSGAIIAKDAKVAAEGAHVVLKVRRPMVAQEGKIDEADWFHPNMVIVGLMSPYDEDNGFQSFLDKKVTVFSLDLLPRITRAQTMDVLSSQANLAGYKAVLEAASLFQRAFPMMMTAAGTVPPAKVLVLGAGVAGLQAIATARRLGAVVSAYDIRPSVKEQVESLGAKFVELGETAQNMETKGGYAKQVTKAFLKKQQEALSEVLKVNDIVICTAAVPGKAAPVLITEKMMEKMKAGSVIVDLAAESGGNCEATRSGSVLLKKGITIIGHVNFPGRLAMDSSQLYARNIYNFLQPHFDDEKKLLIFDEKDEIVKSTLLTHNGQIMHSDFKPKQKSTKASTAEKAASQKSEAEAIKKALKNKADAKPNGKLSAKEDEDVRKDQPKN